MTAQPRARIGLITDLHDAAEIGVLDGVLHSLNPRVSIEDRPFRIAQTVGGHKMTATTKV